MHLVRATEQELIYAEGNSWGYLITGLLLIIVGFALYYTTGQGDILFFKESATIFSEIIIVAGVAALLAMGQHTITFNKRSGTVTCTRTIFFLRIPQEWNLSEIREVQLDKWAIREIYVPIPLLGKVGGGGFIPQLRRQFHDGSVKYLNCGRRMKHFGFIVSRGDRKVGKKIASFLNVPYSEFEKHSKSIT